MSIQEYGERLAGSRAWSLVQMTCMYDGCPVIAPPNLNNPTNTSMQFIKGTVNLPVNDSSLGANEQILTGSSAFVFHFPIYTSNCVYLALTVPKGKNITASTTGAATRGLASGFQVVNNVGATVDAWTTLLWVNPITLPIRSSTGLQFNIQPNLSRDFSRGRLAASKIGIISDAVGIGATTIAGRVCAAAINDTRDVTYDDTSAFPENSLSLQAVTTHDQFVQHPIEDGAVVVQGSDINPGFQPLSFTNFTPVAPLTTSLATNAYASVPILVTPGIFNRTCVYQAFISPWGNTITPGASINHQNFTIPQIDEMGDVDITWSVNFVLGTGAAAISMEIVLQATHIFATSDVDHNAYYTSTFDERAVMSVNTATASAPTMRRQATFSVASKRGSFLSEGKYIGTVLQFLALNQLTTGAPTITVQAGTIYVQARSIASFGTTGPVRVIRWDNVPNSQTINISFNGYAEVQPNSATTALVQTAASNTIRSLDVNTIPLLSHLYNSQSTPFRRVWRARDYRDFVAILKTAGKDEILRWISQDPDLAQGLGLTMAGGLFSTLGSFLGPVGGAVGSVADAVLGAGQFGLTQGAGQFAAGQFAGGNMSGGFRAAGSGFRAANNRIRDRDIVDD